LLAVKGTPQKIVSKHNAELVKALKQPEVEQRYAALGLEAVTSTRRGFAETVKSDSATFAKVIKDAGIKMEVN
jgi:tripartite-type tricarboxylate transporter receptor subunit TctC